MPWHAAAPDHLPRCSLCEAPAAAWPAAACAACGVAYLLNDRFYLLYSLGGGAQGQVWAAWDLLVGAVVAVKQLSLAQAREWKTIELFQRQARVMQALHHPGVPRWVDAFEARHPGVVHFYLAQEYIDGETLAQEQARGARRYAQPELVAIARNVLAILQYLHGHSPPIIHRDVKPSNLMRRRGDGSLVLIDFGLVRDLKGPDSGSTVGHGTHGFAPPEQYAGHASPTTDLYGLGATLIALASGRPPGQMLNSGTFRLEFQPYVNLLPRLVQLLADLVEPDPERRPASAAVVLQRLDDLDRPVAPSAVAVPKPEPATEPSVPPPVADDGVVDRSWVKWAVLIALATVGVLVWAVQYAPSEQVLAPPGPAAAPTKPSGPALFSYSHGRQPRLVADGERAFLALRTTWRDQLATTDREVLALYDAAGLRELWRTEPLHSKEPWGQDFAVLRARVALVEPPAKLRWFERDTGKELPSWLAPDRISLLCPGADGRSLYVQTEGIVWTRLADDGQVTANPPLPVECPRNYNDGGLPPGQVPCRAVDYRGDRLPGTPPGPADGLQVKDFAADACARSPTHAVLVGRSTGTGSQYARLVGVDTTEAEKALWAVDLVERQPEFAVKGNPGVALAGGLAIVYFTKGDQGFLQGRSLTDGALRWQSEVDQQARMFATERVIVVDGSPGRLQVRSPVDGAVLAKLGAEPR